MNKGHLAQSTVNGSLVPVVQITTKLFLLWKCAAKVGDPTKGIETNRFWRGRLADKADLLALGVKQKNCLSGRQCVPYQGMLNLSKAHV